MSTLLAPYADGIPIVAGDSDRAQRFAAPATNQRVYNLTSHAVERYDGAAWVTDPITLGSPVTFPVSAAAGAAGRGPRLISTAEPLFNGELDPGISIGYNMLMTGGLVVGTEPGAAWCVEGDYNDASGQNKMEAYIQFIATDGAYQRPYFASYNRVTKVGTPFISGDQIFFSRKISGIGVPGDNIASFQNDGVNGNNLTLYPCTYGNGTWFTAQGKAATRAGFLFGLVGGTMAEITTDVATRVDHRVNGRETLHVYALMSGAPGDAIAVGVEENAAVGTFQNNGPNTCKCVVGRAGASQTGDIFQAQNSGSTPLAGIKVAGGLYGTDLTLNQGPADNAILQLKSSDVAHGVTGVAETDTYGLARKAVAAEGGLALQGIGESQYGLFLEGLVTTGDTTKSTAALAGVYVNATKKSGSGAGALGANENIAVFASNSVVRQILDADGDSHQDVGTAWTNFDEHDDVALLTELSVQVSRPDDPIRSEFRGFLEANRARLEALKLVTFNEDGHHFINWSRTTMLLVGAVRQLATRMLGLEQVVQQARLKGAF
jgi:hypothetical protein